MVSVTVCARRGEGKNYFRKKKTREKVVVSIWVEFAVDIRN